MDKIPVGVSYTNACPPPPEDSWQGSTLKVQPDTGVERIYPI